jgi:hypothetical protein
MALDFALLLLLVVLWFGFSRRTETPNGERSEADGHKTPNAELGGHSV